MLSGCVDSPGKKGDPCLQFYAPDAGDYPAWWWDSGSLIVTAGKEFSSSPQGNGLYRDTPGAATGAPYDAAGYNPWSTP